MKRRAKDLNKRAICRAHPNLLLNSCEYKIELEDGTTDQIFAKTISENIYSQLDNEGRKILAFGDIIYHRKDKSVLTKEDGFTQLSDGHKKCKQTTRGWQVLVEWKDETTTWMDLKDIKEANLVELAEYVVSSRIDDKPAFTWWVPYTLKKRERII